MVYNYDSAYVPCSVHDNSIYWMLAIHVFLDPPEAQIAAAKEMKEKGTPLVPAEQPKPVGLGGEVEEQEKPKPPVHVIDEEEIVLVCQVMLQKETPDGLKDEACLRAAPVGMAGLCE